MMNLNRLSRLIGNLTQRAVGRHFPGSSLYWEERYARGGHSGAGSYSQLAEFKAEFLNRFVAEHGVEFVIEFGCGDGNQLSLAAYPQYLGFDVSQTAVERCRKRFGADATKQFQLVSDYAGEAAPLTMSLDVIYHLVEDSVFHRYMEQLFDSSSQFVVIYSSNFDKPADDVSHVRHRGFTRWISDHRPEWQLTEFLKNAYPFEESSRRGSLADFYVFSKT